jgi:hypothetical protein
MSKTKMSKTSMFFLLIILLCLCALAGYRGSEAYKKFAAKKNAETPAEPTMFTHAPPPVMPQAGSSISFSNNISQTPPSGATPATGANLETEADAVMAEQYAREHDAAEIRVMDKYAGALMKYLDRPVIRRFNADLQKAGLAETDFLRLNGPDFTRLLQENPALRDVLLKYSRDAEFLATLQDIFADPVTAQAMDEYNQTAASSSPD